MGKWLITWFVSGILLTLICGLVYGTAQQLYRQSANDPQMQIAHDTARSLDAHIPLTTFQTVHMETDLAPFVIVYDKEGKILSSQATLHGKNPVLPDGVLNFSDDRKLFTWQPEQNLRFATVVEKYSGGYVLVGRSLTEIEKRIDRIGMMIGAFWIVANGVMLVSCYVVFVMLLKGKA